VTPRHLVLAAALAGSAGLAAWGGGPADPSPAPTAASVPKPAAAAGRSGRPDTVEPPVLAVVARELLLGDGEREPGDDRNGMFGAQDWTPMAPAPRADAAATGVPTAPPSPPPVPFTVIGKAVGDGVWEVYLARGERTYIVHDKEIIENVYRVDAIAPPVLTLTYLPLNRAQQLDIGVFN
jgi:hypothetical protein